MIKLLHTADWHIGRTNHSKIHPDGRLTKHTDFLEAIKGMEKVLEDSYCEVLIVAGDLAQINRPGPDYIAELISIFKRLEDKVSLMISISGNHDASPSARYNVLQPLYQAFDDVDHFHFIYDKEIECIEYKDINFVCMSHTNELRRKSAANIEKVIAEAPESLSQEKMNILVSHFPIDCAIEVSDETQLVTEKLRFEEIKNVFDIFDLTLLGDIHKEQAITDKAFYSGSLIQNTFNEEGETKSVSVFELYPEEKKFVRELFPIHTREYKTIKIEKIEEISNYIPEAYKDSIVRVKVPITQVERSIEYDTMIREYFKDSFIVLPEFNVVGVDGQVIENISTKELFEAVVEHLEKTYKEDADLEFLKEESKDILSVLQQEKLQRESKDAG